MAVKKQYRDIVRRATVASGAIGVPGALSFGLDVTAMSGVWVTMILAISDKSKHRVDKVFATKLAAGVLAGVAAYVGGSKIAMGLLHLIPGAGTLAAMGVNSSLNALFTYKLGHALSNLFDKGEFDDSDVTNAIHALLTLIVGLPTWSEMSDLVALIREA
jgi:uncharacterized protein (DUF697 family)